jgi:hypothetical protein
MLGEAALPAITITLGALSLACSRPLTPEACAPLKARQPAHPVCATMITSIDEGGRALRAVDPPKEPPPVVLTDVLWGRPRRGDYPMFVEGRLVRRVDDGGTEPIGRAAVFALPASRYTAWVESYAVYAASNRQPGKIDPTILPFLSMTLTDSNGKFSFTQTRYGPTYLFAVVEVHANPSGARDVQTTGVDSAGNPVPVVAPTLAYRHRAILLYGKTVYIQSGSSNIGDVAEGRNVLDPKPYPLVAASGTDFNITTHLTLSALPEPSAQDLAPYDRTGTGAVSGGVRVPLPGGSPDARICHHVLVMPALPYFYGWAQRYAEEISRHFTGHSKLPPHLDKLVSNARCDGQGRFTVGELPPGKYLVLAFANGSVTGYVPRTATQTTEHEIVTTETDRWGGEHAVARSSYTTTEQVVTGYTAYAKCTQQAVFSAVAQVRAGQVTETGVTMMGSSFEGAGCSIVVTDP